MESTRSLNILGYLSVVGWVKLGLTVGLILLPNLLLKTPAHLVLELLEFFLLGLGSLVFGRKLRVIGYLFQSLSTLIIVAQEWVRVFGGSYISKIMIDNLANIHALGPALPKYVAMVVVILVIAFLPLSVRHFPKPIFRISLVLLNSLFFTIVAVSGKTTAITSLENLFASYHAAAQTEKLLTTGTKAKKQVLASFEQHQIKSGITIKTKRPNVIVIFAEGTSQTVIDQTATRYPGLMPNVYKFGQETIRFRNYYNHAAATYKGLRGQLYSGYQYRDGYEGTSSAEVIARRTKTALIGLPQILNQHGYQSTFINPEPNHKQFTPYLNQLGFDQVISGDPDTWTGNNEAAFLSDKNNFNLLYQTALKNEKKTSKPFFLGTYTLQTHNSWSVSENQYGDGSNNVLNKFHNFDTVFGTFLKQFMASPLKKNTILILTTDHASYSSPDYAKTMNDQRGEFVSRIPLMIYYPGVQAKTINVKGRNSLGLAPTILDLFNINQVKNYFLGTSLFTDSPTKYEYASEIGGSFYSTSTGTLRDFTHRDEPLQNDILRFDSLSLNMK